jgi:hypothetical protein
MITELEVEYNAGDAEEFMRVVVDHAAGIASHITKEQMSRMDAEGITFPVKGKILVRVFTESV